MDVGTVRALWLYPVKSLRGEQLQLARVDANGVAGDRARVLVDAATGRYATADRVRAWANLFELRAEGEGDGLRITLPDGSVVGSDDEPALSGVLGRPVRVAAHAAPYHAEAPMHLVATSTLDRYGFDARRFRPNVVIETDADENGWVGRTLALGDEVRIEVDGRCVRCVMTTLAQDELPRDKSVLDTVVRENDRRVGVLGVVVRGGTVCPGDRVRLA
jgi:uncharacterized protein YcbX